jgi:hypothetical protein
MPFELHLQYVPVYSKTSRTGSRAFHDDNLGIINACKIENAIWSLKYGVSLEQAALMRFKSIVEQLTLINYKYSYFDQLFSEHIERDVIAPKITFDTYRDYLIVVSVDRGLEDLVTSEYLGQEEPDYPLLPLLILKNNYVIDRESGDKLAISKEVIAHVSQEFASNYGFACVGCSNFESLPKTKWSS